MHPGPGDLSGRPGRSVRRSATLLELLVSLALVTVATLAVLDLMAALFGTATGRMRRTDDVGQVLRVAQRLTVDLEAARVTADGPRTFTSHRTAVVPVVDAGRAGGVTPVTYRFDDASGVLERGEPTRGYTRVARLEGASLRFDIAPLESAGGESPPQEEAARVVTVHLSCGPPVRTGSTAAQRGTTRVVDVVLSRVVLPPVCAGGPPGWLEPGAPGAEE